MSGNEYENFEEMVRAIAREVSRAADRVAQIDVDEIARTIGVDPTATQHWFDTASSWLRSQAEHVEEEFSFPDEGTEAAPSEEEDPLKGAAPHPLDLPTDEQGLALAALDSGRWSVEPGSDRLVSHGDAPNPRDALGLVSELRARDWIGADGDLTLVGRHALSRWLDASSQR